MNILKSLFISLFVLIIVNVAYGQYKNYDDANIVAYGKLIELGKQHSFELSNTSTYYSNDQTPLFYIFELKPQGYIAVTANINLHPVIAYSLTNNYKHTDNQKNVLTELLYADIQNRLHNLQYLSNEVITERNNEWHKYLSGNIEKQDNRTFQQWPPEGSTSTGGWLETNWSQGSFYNKFCPMDPVTELRSIAGCPAIALAMIINFYETLNKTEFTDDDDYLHSYAGRVYTIDDDYEEIDFLSFPEINIFFDSISSAYTNSEDLLNDEISALCFACGVAATQVYTSSVSGTFGVEQALEAYMRFDFENAILMHDEDPGLYDSLSSNMMNARPVHLAVVDEGWTMGHNVVMDGYNTDDYYHLNFGWGGSYNGWYLIPDEIPYGLTVIEGAIVNIDFPPDPYVGIAENDNFSFNIFPNPTNGIIDIEFTSQIQKISVSDISGKNLLEITKPQQNKKIDLSHFESGIYLVSIYRNGRIYTASVVRE